MTSNASQEFLSAWSADEQWIYFCSDRSGSNQLWKIRASASGEAEQITRNGAFEAFASPGGEEIFYTKESGLAGLWRISVKGGEETPIAELSEAGYWRSRAVAENGIYFVAYSPNPPYKIKFYGFQRKQLEEIITAEKPPVLIYSGLAAAPSAQFLFYTQYDQNPGSIMLAELGR